MAQTFFAPAKINLALHVTGRRDDGYHLIETLVAFADFGDQLTVSPAESDRLSVDGPYAAALADLGSDNIIEKARKAFSAACGQHGLTVPALDIRLTKNLPPASGIGGGSSDASAMLRAMMQFCDGNLPDAVLREIAIKLGADVPMCLADRPLIATGIGEKLTMLEAFPEIPIVLANPGVGVSTPSVFAALSSRDNPPLPVLPDMAPDNLSGWCNWIGGHTRNDMQMAAATLCPVIDDCLDALNAHSAFPARMSGSGATCFAFFADMAEAQKAASRLRDVYPAWFIQPCKLRGHHEPH